MEPEWNTDLLSYMTAQVLDFVSYRIYITTVFQPFQLMIYTPE